jgi:hypothetical protein
MTPPNIATLLNMTESGVLDFKSAQYRFWHPATDNEKGELLKDIIAFANSFKTCDAFIVVGVSEKNQRKDQVVGVVQHLNDNDVQQFVNSKTNRRINYLVHSTIVEGKEIDIIQIDQHQERPIYLKKNFGNVKAKEVWIRAGSSSEIAGPDQIADMAKADLKAGFGETLISMEWSEADAHTRLGSEVVLNGVRLIDPPPSPKPTPRLPTACERQSDGMSFSDILECLQPPVAQNFNFRPSDWPTPEELKGYARSRALFKPLRIWLKNIGTRNVSNVKVRIKIPKLDGVVVCDARTLPKKPRGHGLQSFVNSWNTSLFLDTHVSDVSARCIMEKCYRVTLK